MAPLLNVAITAAVARPEEAQVSQTQTKATQPSLTREQRIEQRKTTRQTRLSNAQSNRLRNRCKAAQTVLVAHLQKVETVESNRTKSYEKIQSRLDSLVQGVGTQVDTTELQAAVTSLKDKIDAFKASVNAYKETVSDVSGMDCTADPAGFRASLDTAKVERGELLQEATGIRIFIQQTVKPALQEVRTSLQSAQTAENS